jgi:hypothetical protein
MASPAKRPVAIPPASRSPSHWRNSAKLGDARATKSLENVLFRRADINQRMNASYALARLLDQGEDRTAVGEKLLVDPDLIWCRFPFGKGLIEGGDDAGVEFLSIRHVGESADLARSPGTLFYHLDLRLGILSGFKSPKVGSFIEEILGFEPWHDLLLFKPGSARIDPNASPKPPKNETEA